jgi:hypothetical protein
MKKENIKIFIATHKNYNFPNLNIYIPLHVGREGKQDFGYLADNTGDNISSKNANYCELTGLYWIWKNCDCDYVGLVHYRRYFSNRGYFVRKYGKNKYNYILKKEQILKILKAKDIIVPKQKKYLFQTIREGYNKNHYSKDMDEIGKIIDSKYPEYMETFENFMNGKKICICNMFIMKKTDFDKYCSWLFDILFELESRIDISNYNKYQARIYGFISERLFNVWIIYNKYNLAYIPVLETEPIPFFKKLKSLMEKSSNK